jgi:hypothetical protein
MNEKFIFPVEGYDIEDDKDLERRLKRRFEKYSSGGRALLNYMYKYFLNKDGK